MLQIQVLRQQTDWVKERLAIKNFKQISLVDELVKIDLEIRELKIHTETVQSAQNSAAKKIGSMMAAGDVAGAEVLKTEVAELKLAIAADKEKLSALEQVFDQKLLLIPNLPNVKVPAGTSAEDNEVVSSGGNIPRLYEGAKPHWDLIKEYKLVDFETGATITGRGFPVYTGKGAKLQRALIQFFLDYNIEAGYTEYLPPLLVNEASAYGTGSLPDKEGQMYHITEDNLYLIPTAEVPLTNIFANKIITAAELPLRLTGYTPCFRREAGSFGADVRGLNRLHQFDKVEIVQIVPASDSEETHQQMLNHVERLLQYLELPYRILKLCGGDMSFTSALTYDFEVFSVAQQKWLEVSSVSNFETFQTNRMKIRHKNEEGKTELLHSLNGSSLALPRIVAALLENNQEADGIHIPKALQNYFGAALITKP